MITKADLLMPRELKTKVIEVEGLGTVIAQELSASDGAKLEVWRRKHKTANELKNRVIELCLVDDAGSRILADGEAEEMTLSWSQSNHLAVEIMILNGLIDPENQEEETEKIFAESETTS